MSGTERVWSRRRRRRWLFVGGGSVAVLAVGTVGLGEVLDARETLGWALVTCGLLAWEAWFFASRDDRDATSDPIGVANAVTVSRGWLYAAVGGFVAVRPTGFLAWLPGLCYGLGVVLDQLDGRIARRIDDESKLGEKLDVAFDTVGFLVAPSVAVAWGRLPVWYLLLPVAQYLYKLAKRYREWRGLTVRELAPSTVRRRLSGTQMVFLTVALLPVIAPGPLAAVGAVLLAFSLGMFVRDYLVLAGHYRPSADGYS